VSADAAAAGGVAPAERILPRVDAGEPPPEPARPSVLRLRLSRPLAQRDFRLLWIGETVSLLGDQCYFVALPFVVLDLTGSGLALGTVLMAAAIPRAGFMLFGGVTSDRVAPRTVMIASDWLRAGVAGGMALLVIAGGLRLWHVYTLAFVFGLVDAFFFPAWTTIFPLLVEKEDLEPANAVTQGSAQLTALLGPAPAGLLISTVGIAAAFAVDAASFVWSAAAFSLMRATRRQVAAPVQPAPNPPPNPGVLRGIREGLRYAWGDPVIRAILVVIAAINLGFAGPFMVGAAALARGRFALGATALGILLSAAGGGALLGTLAAGLLERPPHRGRMLITVSLLLSVGVAGLAFAPNVWTAAAIVLPIGIAAGFTNIIVVSWLQGRGDPAMVGRLMALVMLASTGLQPLSYVIAGALVDWHLEAMFLGAGCLILMTGVLCAANPVVRSIE
jgi:MFS family permease